MKFEEKAKRNIEASWNHGRFVDLWSIIHIISGVMLGLVVLALDINFFYGLLFALVGMIAYEAYEMILKIIEDAENSITDVVLGILGYIASYQFFGSDPTTNYVLYLLFFVVVNAALFYIGWQKYLRRKMRSTT